MLIWRLLVSAILIPMFAGAFYLDMRLGPSAPILLAIILTLALCGAREMVDLLWTRSFTPNKVIVSACCVLVAAAAGSVLIIWRHRSNIERIRAGTENVFRFGRSKK